MALLDIENLHIEFSGRRGNTIAIQQVSLSLDKGEILGIVGESGAGKSTIGNAVIGLLKDLIQAVRDKIQVLQDIIEHILRHGFHDEPVQGFVELVDAAVQRFERISGIASHRAAAEHRCE